MTIKLLNMGYIKIQYCFILDLVGFYHKKVFEFMYSKYVYFRYGYIYETNLTEP